MLVGWLNDAFNENCASCRDAVGHFCATRAVDRPTCASSTGICAPPAGGWAFDAGQQKGAKFSTLKAHISARFHSFQLIFGRVIISPQVLVR